MLLSTSVCHTQDAIWEEPLLLTVVLESCPGLSSSSFPETHGSNWKMAPVSLLSSVGVTCFPNLRSHFYKAMRAKNIIRGNFLQFYLFYNVIVNCEVCTFKKLFEKVFIQYIFWSYSLSSPNCKKERESRT